MHRSIRGKEGNCEASTRDLLRHQSADLECGRVWATPRLRPAVIVEFESTQNRRPITWLRFNYALVYCACVQMMKGALQQRQIAL
jgi:hypothetical protein